MPDRRTGLPRLETLIYLAILAFLAGMEVNPPHPSTYSGTPPPTAGATPPATALALDYNARFGNNRPAATAALLIGRILYSDAGYWEVFVETQPASLPTGGATDAISVLRAGRPASSVLVVMASEAGDAIKRFAGRNVATERAEVLKLARLAAVRFPSASITVRVYYGEQHQHASATYAGGKLTYTVLDHS
jgi:hypothetical protein